MTVAVFVFVVVSVRVGHVCLECVALLGFTT